MEPNTPLTSFPGIGEQRAKSFAKLGLVTAGDLPGYLPRLHEDRRERYTIATAPLDRAVCIPVLLTETPRLMNIRRGLDVTRMKVVDDSGAMLVSFFNQGYLRQSLHPGEDYMLYGKVDLVGNHRQMTNPYFEPMKFLRYTGRIMPIYPLTAGVSNHMLVSLMEECLHQLPQPVETLPDHLLEKHQLPSLVDSYQEIHFPPDFEALDKARRRFAFEELFYLGLGLAFLKARRSGEEGLVLEHPDTSGFYPLLPFQPTGAQKKVIAEIAQDFTSGYPMNRLVQGDVGSGKTVVAAAGIWMAHQAGWQSAMMVPTEILARQHHKSLTALLEPAGIRVGLLTGSLKASEKKQVYAALEKGDIDLVVGTHALLSGPVAFANLGLVVADEQHRFGVEQRATLAAKSGSDHRPHVLVMSATPIPRTLALIIYGDLDLSIMDELPAGRVPIKTALMSEAKRKAMYGFVREQVTAGRQVYMVCPAVEENLEAEGGWDLKAVTGYATTLREEIFPDLSVGLVHGKLKPKEKQSVMADFTAGSIDILVATTVIEVGVDVPNANLMVIENADRYGLSQLHQLRGRVGRGQYQSWCILVSDNRNPETRARLKVLTDSADGFRIAEEDLKLRGPGDFFGARQHGLPALRVADLTTDSRVLKEAQEAAEELLRQDPKLEQAQHRPLLDKVKQLFEENPDMFN